MDWSNPRHGKQRPFFEDDDPVYVTVNSGISYSEMSSGTWTVLLEAPEHEFTIQRQFNLTMGARNDNTVTVTVRSPTTSVLG
jgi:hypothetical protein